MEAGLDTGPVLLAKKVPIETKDTAGTLHDKLAQVGAEAVVEVLQTLDRLIPCPQPEEGVTYAAKITKDDARLDWTLPAKTLGLKTRAYNPVPAAWALWQGEPIKIWQAVPVEGSGSPGKVLAAGEDGLVIACGTGALTITELQKSGGKRMSVAEFLRGSAAPDRLT
jgi:methionyl-tRNA formyltransferase